MTGTKKIRLVSTLLAVALAVTLLVGSVTFSYLQDKTDPVTNNFKTNKVTVEIGETTGDTYEIIPGTTQDKDPKVTVDATIDAKVYLYVTDHTEGLVDYEIDTSVWKYLCTNQDGEKVYFRLVSGSDSPQEFNILVKDSVGYDPAITNEDMENLSDLTLSFRAEAIQTNLDPENTVSRLIMDQDHMGVLWTTAQSKFGAFGEDIPIETTDNADNFLLAAGQLELDMNGYSLVNQRVDDAESMGGFYTTPPPGTANPRLLLHSGSVIDTRIGIFGNVQNGSITLNDVRMFGISAHVVYAYQGRINVESGYYEAAYSDGMDCYAALNLHDQNGKNGNASISVTGGTFKNFDPSDNASENPQVSFVASGYEVQGFKIRNGAVVGDAADYQLRTNYDNEDYAYYFVVVPEGKTATFAGFETVTATTRGGDYERSYPVFTIS